MAEPRLSIVTITYKDPEGLARTLKSLHALKKHAPDVAWEHVVVDSSPADTATLIAGLKAEGWPLVHLTPAAEGVYAAQNAGLDAARGELIWFLNGGDLLHSAPAVERVLTTFDETGSADLVVCTVEARRGEKFLYMHRPKSSALASLAGMNRVCHQAIVYRREVFERVGKFNPALRLAADYEHHLRCFAADLNVVTLVDDVLAVYDMSGRSQEYSQVFEEFKAAQRSTAKLLPSYFVAANEVVRPIELARVALFKLLARSPFARWLQPVWLVFKRK